MAEFKRTKSPEPIPDGIDITDPREQRYRAIDACARVLSESKNKPPELAGDPRLKAAWWVDYMQEPVFYPSDRPQMSGRGGVIEPYLVRGTNTLRKFLYADETFRRYIVAAREDNIHWRGDEFPMFTRVVDTTMQWRELDDAGKARLKTEIIRKARGFMRAAV